MEYVAIQLSGGLEKGNFKTKNEAWEWIYDNECDDCKKTKIHSCASEWDVVTRDEL